MQSAADFFLFYFFFFAEMPREQIPLEGQMQIALGLLQVLISQYMCLNICVSIYVSLSMCSMQIALGLLQVLISQYISQYMCLNISVSVYVSDANRSGPAAGVAISIYVSQYMSLSMCPTTTYVSSYYCTRGPDANRTRYCLFFF
jgi:hypothetical protein